MAQKAKNMNVTDELLSRYFSGEASPEEAMTIDDWRGRNNANNKEFNALRTAWNATSALPYVMQDATAAWQQMQPLPQRTRPQRIHIATWAAAAVLTGIIICAAILLRPVRQHTVTTTADETRQLKLPDGSGIILLANSTFTYPETFATPARNVSLQGKAGFDIHGNAAQPFIITAGGLQIKVLGTAFNVAEDDTCILVKMLTGKILMYTISDTLPVAGGQTAVYSKKDQRIRYDRVFHFENEDLSVVCKALTEAYQTNIIIDQPAIASLKISSNFDNKTLDYVLEVIATTLNIQYTRKPETNEIHFTTEN
ncbi:FecR family protein [Chitinophaga pinensis]|uniref:Anti-FecI sigma factor, FecR n=1 Tax=Chitinophaga pinensis (strain ATCC 43595 / DSM 2588 / LMG 13176 / NBRC 15968 / NCIMB 11800 / UQM 2034) TaxID=485918 RepID=A0A979FZ54_CHIPD|nr:FecR domain-containing protein [Chitinophaga pinensis]ACU57804.1 anti-FecI sigma factor, FecR [Chitinophaga pinensis DSM 2588]